MAALSHFDLTLVMPLAAGVGSGLAILVLCVVAGIGTVLLLPGKRERSFRSIGGVLVLLAGLIGMALIAKVAANHTAGDAYFWIFSFIAIVCSIRVITHSKPVYSALYFVLAVLATSGLFVLLWAEFMAAALVLIYAGAILITYVFVIMLAAQAHTGVAGEIGGADYDANSREPLKGAVVGFAVMGVLLFVIFDKMQGMDPVASVAQQQDNASEAGDAGMLASPAGDVPTEPTPPIPQGASYVLEIRLLPPTTAPATRATSAPATRATTQASVESIVPAVFPATIPATQAIATQPATQKTPDSPAIVATAPAALPATQMLPKSFPNLVEVTAPATQATTSASATAPATQAATQAATQTAATTTATTAASPTTAAATQSAPTTVATTQKSATQPTTGLAITPPPATGPAAMSHARPPAPAEGEDANGTVRGIGVYLFSKQVINLEVAGLILTLAMVGAIVIAGKRVHSEVPVTHEEVTGPATPVNDDPHSIPVYGTDNPAAKAFPET